MSPKTRHGDQRDEPLDISTTREGPSVDEEKRGFQNVEGPGSRRGGAPASPREDQGRTPGDGTLQDAVPAGLSSDELRRRAEEDEGSAQPGTG